MSFSKLLVFTWMMSMVLPVFGQLVATPSKSLFESDKSVIPPVDVAFQLSLEKTSDFIEVRWLIAPNCYLYKEKLAFSLDIVGSDIPVAVPHYDDFFGEVEVYFDELVLRLPLTSKNRLEEELVVSFQGCSKLGFCYPQQRRIFNF